MGPCRRETSAPRKILCGDCGHEFFATEAFNYGMVAEVSTPVVFPGCLRFSRSTAKTPEVSHPGATIITNNARPITEEHHERHR